MRLIGNYSGKMDKINEQIMNPVKLMPKELFQYWTKYAIIICNEKYDKKYTTMGNLPAVLDDFKNAKLTVKFMDIPEEQTFEIRDALYDQLDQVIFWLK